MSPYLERPIGPLTVALPRRLAQIEMELAGKRLKAAGEQRLRRRVELIRLLLRRGCSPSPP